MRQKTHRVVALHKAADNLSKHEFPWSRTARRKALLAKRDGAKTALKATR